MDDLEIAHLTATIQKQHTRTAILMVLRAIYPKTVSLRVLRTVLDRAHGRDVADAPLFVEVHYLHEKGLLKLNSSSSRIAKVRITPRGIDYLEGSVEEVGLVSPELCR